MKPRLLMSAQDSPHQFASDDTLVVRVTHQGDVCVLEVRRKDKPFPGVLHLVVPRDGSPRELEFKAIAVTKIA
jgi:hypothetical protein